MGRFARRIVWTMMTIAPPKIPDEPNPTIAHPTINAVEFGAAPQIAEPIPNSPIALKNTILVE
jgi:hypothetical protein